MLWCVAESFDGEKTITALGSRSWLGHHIDPCQDIKMQNDVTHDSYDAQHSFEVNHNIT